METKLDLKWRPFQLEDVVGQDHVIQAFTAISKKNAFNSAYLFSGNHGCGKTTMARIVANLATCENPVNGKLCGKCRACRTIKGDMSVDVRELNGATSRGIDEAKSLIEAARLSPQELKRKVIILDEVHQLTREAISALLKILEEPPSYTIFILCTTEIKKIPSTILSRCQKFNFRKISSRVILDRIKLIAEKEKIDIEPEALVLVAKMARGSLREAVVSLEQVGVLFENKKVTAENTRNMFGQPEQQGIVNIANAIIKSDYPLILDTVNDMVLAGVNPKEFLYEVSELFRNMMLLKVNANGNLDLPDYETMTLKKMSEGLTLAQLLKMSHSLSEIDKKLEYNINERWVIEATLIGWAKLLEAKQ